MLEQLKSVGQSLKREVRRYLLLIDDDRTPLLAKWLLVAAVGYLLLPFDLIPDFLPVIGHLDDAVIVPVLVIAALRMVPSGLLEEYGIKAAVVAGPPAVSTTVNPPDNVSWLRRLNQSGRLSRIMAVVALFWLLGSGYRWMQTLEPVRIVRGQLQAIDEGLYPRAYAYLSATAKARLSFEEFVALAQNNSVVTECRESTFLSRQVSGSRASISGRLEGYSAYVSDASYLLVKEDGEWKIESVQWAPPRHR